MRNFSNHGLIIFDGIKEAELYTFSEIMGKWWNRLTIFAILYELQFISLFTINLDLST